MQPLHRFSVYNWTRQSGTRGNSCGRPRTGWHPTDKGAAGRAATECASDGSRPAPGSGDARALSRPSSVPRPRAPQRDVRCCREGPVDGPVMRPEEGDSAVRGKEAGRRGRAKRPWGASEEGQPPSGGEGCPAHGAPHSACVRSAGMPSRTRRPGTPSIAPRDRYRHPDRARQRGRPREGVRPVPSGQRARAPSRLGQTPAARAAS